jgi:hypothetical protein
VQRDSNATDLARSRSWLRNGQNHSLALISDARPKQFYRIRETSGLSKMTDVSQSHCSSELQLCVQTSGCAYVFLVSSQ